MTKVEAKGNFAQVQMEKLLGHAAIVVEPILRIASEPFNAVEMITPVRTAFPLAPDHVVPSHRQRGVGLPVVGVIHAARLGGATNQR